MLFFLPLRLYFELSYYVYKLFQNIISKIKSMFYRPSWFSILLSYMSIFYLLTFNTAFVGKGITYLVLTFPIFVTNLLYSLMKRNKTLKNIQCSPKADICTPQWNVAPLHTGKKYLCNIYDLTLVKFLANLLLRDEVPSSPW